MKKILSLGVVSLLVGCGDPSSNEERNKPVQAAASKIDVATVVEIIRTRCSSCHSKNPTDNIFKVSPSGVMLENLAQIQRAAPRIYARSVATQTMPFMNKTQMTEEERMIVGQWITAGAPSE